jgi:hypothetical protein
LVQFLRNPTPAPTSGPPFENLPYDLRLLLIDFDLTSLANSRRNVPIRSSASRATILGQKFQLVSDPSPDLFAIVLVYAPFDVEHHKIIFASCIFGLRHDCNPKPQQLIYVARLHFHVAPQP